MSCFIEGMNGRCNPECYIYQEGHCTEPQEMLDILTEEELILHEELYQIGLIDKQITRESE